MRNLMKQFYRLIITTIAFFVSVLAHGQDSLAVTQKQWDKLKAVQVEASRSVSKFANLPAVKKAAPDLTKHASSSATVFSEFSASVLKLDDASMARVKELQRSMLTSVGALLNRVMADKLLVAKPEVKAEGNRLEIQLKRLCRQIHEFNFQVYEKAGSSLKFENCGL